MANPRKLRFIFGSNNKSDTLDAKALARDLAVLRARHAAVTVRTKLVNAVRGIAKSMGERLPKCAANAMSRERFPELPPLLRPALDPLLDAVAAITDQIKGYDRVLEELASERYPETAILRQVTGVGVLTSLAFILTLERPERFRRSRDMGPFLGLVPRRDQSGDCDRQLRITKAGDSFVRMLLVQSAHYVLGPFGPDSDLKRHGLQLATGTSRAKRRAVVAVARKLAVLLHALWKTGEEYEPLRQAGGSCAA